MSALPAGFVLRRPRVPLVPGYCVLSLDPARAGTSDLAELLRLADRVARGEALARFGDPECFALLCNAGRTRRRRWPHVHIILAPSVRAKRWALLWLSLKHLSRPWCWPGLRRLWQGPRPRPQVEHAR
ncbi:MAG: hypothetical protein H6712_18825 [Myxococcales bacterium]|nr:hypothetical protein [Myxococcales bacterium]MCB9715929.1 hypothetical protein [Myxococcales bacterium]